MESLKIAPLFKVLLLPLTLTLIGCGGGSGGGSSASPLPSVSTAVFIASDTETMNGDVKLYSVDDDGANLRLLSENIASNGAQVTPEPPRVIGSQPPSVFSFDWSPDSQRLVMAGNLENRNTIAQEIFVVNADGTGFEKISGGIGEPPRVEVRNPQWSPDGQFIIQEVARFSEDTGEARKFSWSPEDAEEISFNAPDGDGNALFVWNVATDQREKVSGTLPEFADVTAFEWAPAGNALGFVVSSEEEKSKQLFSVAPGNAPVLVSENIGADDVVAFAWSPTSERLAFSSKADGGVGYARINRLTAVSVDGSEDKNLLNGGINDVISVAYEGARESRVSVSSLFPPPQPPTDTQPERVTFNSIAVVGFPATTSTGQPWDRIALFEAAKRPDMLVSLFLNDVDNGFGFSVLYESNEVNNAFPRQRYVFTERNSGFSPGPLPETVNFRRRDITIDVTDNDSGGLQLMATIPYIPVNRRTPFSMGEVVSLSNRDGVMIELDVTYGF